MGPEPAGVVQLQALVARIISLLVGIGFIVVVVMLVTAGIKYITSGGDQKSLQAASNTITWALLGIAFMVLIWIFVKVIQAFTGVNVTSFCIGLPPYCL